MTAEHIHTHSHRVRQDGTEYEARIVGASRKDGTWEAWIEFRPTGDPNRVLKTGQETSQPDRRALVYWAGGLEPVYLEGALARALAYRGRAAETQRSTELRPESR